jgi:7-cyano-7-deazaguanine synthase
MQTGETAQNRALVLFSGGQDSTVCLAWALARYDAVETLGFDYGQSHKVELDCRARIREKLSEMSPDWAARLGPDHTLALPALNAISESALTRDVEIEMGENGLPTSFVPGRNLLFFTYASALAYRRGAATIIGGMCETDYSGYPDCRDETIVALEEAVSLGLDKAVTFETPLMWLDKAATWTLAKRLGGMPLVDLVLEHTHSCYRGDRTSRHAWGYGCSACPACDLRAKGYAAYLAAKEE